MSRMKVLRANPRRGLAALATVLVAVGVTGASGANFNASTANAANTFTAGSLSMTNDVAGAILTASNMRPGGPAVTGEVEIKNTGSLSAPFTLDRGAVNDPDPTYKVAPKLDLVVTDCGADLDCSTAGDNSNVYTGTLAAMGTGIALGTFAANEAHRYEFAATLNNSVDNNWQSKSATATFAWNATS
jgi:spore coat-associated protein N